MELRTVENDELLSDLLNLRNLLSDKNRWVQNRLRMPHPDGELSFCLIGASRRVTGVDTEAGEGDGASSFMGRSGAVVGALNEVIGTSWNQLTFHPVATWNDAPGRTHAEVLALLDTAIEKRRAAAL